MAEAKMADTEDEKSADTEGEKSADTEGEKSADTEGEKSADTEDHTIADTQDENRASRDIAVVSIVILLALIVSNWISMIVPALSVPGLDFGWPNGWFNNDLLMGFALAGAAVNILITHGMRYRTKDSKSSYAGRYALRLLEATVFVAVVYLVGRLLLPTIDPECSSEVSAETTRQCLSISAPIFLIIGLLVGLFVSLIEDFMVRLLPRVNWLTNTRETRILRERYEKHRREWEEFARNHPSEFPNYWDELESRSNMIDRLLRQGENDQAAQMIHELEMILLKWRIEPDEAKEQ